MTNRNNDVYANDKDASAGKQIIIRNQSIENIESIKELNSLVDYKESNIYSDIVIQDSIIKSLNIAAFRIYSELQIENCVIHALEIPYCWFMKGLVFRNNIVFDSVNYEAGGHNKQPMIIESNYFHGFFDFFDCQFHAPLILKNNTFKKGYALLAYRNEPGENSFDSDVIIENNIGLDSYRTG